MIGHSTPETSHHPPQVSLITLHHLLGEILSRKLCCQEGGDLEKGGGDTVLVQKRVCGTVGHQLAPLLLTSTTDIKKILRQM